MQARVPEFDLSPEPGGAWDWLLGLIAGGGVTLVLIVASRRLMRRRRSAPEEQPSSNEGTDEEWEDRLDDELREID